MQSRYAVYRKSVVDIHVRHVDAPVGVDDICRSIAYGLSDTVVKLSYDRKKLGRYGIKIVYGPFFKRFRKYRMIGVSAGLPYHLYRLIHRKAFFLQEPDKLGNDHRRMRVIYLYGDMLI